MESNGQSIRIDGIATCISRRNSIVATNESAKGKAEETTRQYE